MTPQERDLIVHLFERLRQQANQPKDRDAETLIGQGVAQVPDAPYSLVQTVLIQDMALAEAHNRIQDLEQQVAAARTAPPPAPTSFLGGARGSVPNAGPWSRPAASAPPPPPPQGSPWSPVGQPAYGAPPAMAPLAAPGASSGFLRQAATTAAGVAGGALLFEGISSLFGPHYGGGMFGGMTPQPGLGETVINNYYNDDQPSDRDLADDRRDDNDQNFTDASDQDYSSDQDSGSDFGGNDDGGGTIDV
ncbi:MAG TPA: DUF2076 domain-containing protein [Stellaceae bacterium]|nr:DUF2076 domain-containing protein [Stellaceae bacterium]